MFRIDRSVLDRLCSPPLDGLAPVRANDIVRQLGGLARWWLCPEVLARAAEHDAAIGYADDAGYWQARPPLPEAHGSCLVVFAGERPRNLPLLREAFLLPLRWTAGSGHSRRLPPALGELAMQVVEVLRPQLVGSDWGLHLDPDGLADCDLSGLDFSCDSAWAALAGGLLVADRGGHPNPRVWASASWRPDAGLQDVGGLDAKLCLAHEYHVERFYLPASMRVPAEAWLTGRADVGLPVGWLATVELDPRRALADYLAALDVPPSPDDPRDRRRDYYLREPDPARARAFYLENLLPDIADDCRARLEHRWPGWSPTHFITVVSDSPEVILLAARVLRFEHCLLLHTPDKAQQRDALVRQLAAEGIASRGAEFRADDTMRQRFAQAIREFLGPAPTDHLALDLTPGSKPMSLSLFVAAPPGSRLLYWWHRFDDKFRRATPFTEDPWGWIAPVG